MFASKVTKDVALLSDPAVQVTLRKLSWTQREEAQRAKQVELRKDLVDVGGAMLPTFLVDRIAERVGESLVTGGTPAATNTPRVIEDADPMLTHDKLTVLMYGITGWTVPDPIDKANISDLDPDDADFLAREILALSIRPRTEHAEKNGESGSTGTSTESSVANRQMSGSSPESVKSLAVLPQ